MKNKVLIIGGGMAGLTAAIDLANANKKALLVDAAPAVGGIMTQLDRTFPTNNCDLCTMAPHLDQARDGGLLAIKTMTEVLKVNGEAGHFSITMQTRPRFIDLTKCTACGECRKKYPEAVSFTPGLDADAPTCMRYPKSTPEAYAIDPAKCSDPGGLQKCCPVQAIDLDQQPLVFEESAAAIILAPGAELFDPSHLDYFGYGQEPDVLTSLDFERMLSASGPTGGRLIRPSSQEPPKNIAWIQCVGSRGLQKGAAPYCSSACCMFALKEAIMAKQRVDPEISATIFYMDMRTYGKDYELYLNKAEKDWGVRLVHSRPHSIIRPPDADHLNIIYANDNSTQQITEDFDMVVLACGFKISGSVKALMQEMGLALTHNNFPETDKFNPLATSIAGIYACGIFQTPQDIPETITQAKAAACLAGALVKAEAKPPATKPAAPERDVSQEEPKVGVFICQCSEGTGSLDTKALTQAAAQMPAVALAETVDHVCNAAARQQVKEAIAQNQLNRVVIAGCSPRTHLTSFQDLLAEAGLNKYLVDVANIREQAAWVHTEATVKASQLIAMSVANMSKAKPLAEAILPANKKAMVLGGGVAGLTAAHDLAEQGVQVFLVEKAASLGGVARELAYTIEGGDVQAWLNDLVAKVENHPKIEVLRQTEISRHTGSIGMFRTTVITGGNSRELDHGVTILATGAQPNRPPAYLLGQSPLIYTQLELQKLLYADPALSKTWNNLVMIQCVGSREPDNPNCSRLCCQSALKNALHILDQNPDARIFMLYRDIRAYGFMEEYYQKARAQGVIFVRFNPDNPPEINISGNKALVTYHDAILNQTITVEADGVALSTGLKADLANNQHLGHLFKLSLTSDGYFQEIHAKLRPVELSVPGVLAAGSAHSPKLIRENVTQARAAAAQALTCLAQDVINVGVKYAVVDRVRCSACVSCVRACPYGVPFINTGQYSQIDPDKCYGCGACAAVCPGKAIQLNQFSDAQILAKLDDLLEGAL